jgi:hypothetical protein
MDAGKSESFDYRLRLQVAEDNVDRLLLAYIKAEQHLTYSEKEMVLAALRMCWLPCAYHHHLKLGNVAPEDLQQVGMDAILRLKEQIYYIATLTGVQGWSQRVEERVETTYPRVSIAAAVKPIAPYPSAASLNQPTLEDGYDRDLFEDG